MCNACLLGASAGARCRHVVWNKQRESCVETSWVLLLKGTTTTEAPTTNTIPHFAPTSLTIDATPPASKPLARRTSTRMRRRWQRRGTEWANRQRIYGHEEKPTSHPTSHHTTPNQTKPNQTNPGTHTHTTQNWLRTSPSGRQHAIFIHCIAMGGWHETGTRSAGGLLGKVGKGGRGGEGRGRTPNAFKQSHVAAQPSPSPSTARCRRTAPR